MKRLTGLISIIALAAFAFFVVPATTAHAAKTHPKKTATTAVQKAIHQCDVTYKTAVKHAWAAYHAAIKAAPKKGKAHTAAVKAAMKARKEALATARADKKSCIAAARKK